MNHIYKGSALIVVAIYFLWVAYNNSNKPVKVFWAILALGFILRFFVSLDPFLHDWDERYHALVAKNLMDDMLRPLLHKTVVFNYDFRDWTNNYIWLHKPPLSLWFMSTSMNLFGVNEVALRLPSIIVSTLSIALTYKIAFNLYPENKAIGLMAMFFQSINGFVIEISGGRVPTDHVDTLLLFWIELGIWVAIRKTSNNWNFSKILLIVLITNLAILTKWLVGLFIPFLFFFYEYLTKTTSIYIRIRKFFIIGLFSLIIPIVWAMYLISNHPMEFSWEQSLNARHFYEVIEGHSGEWWYYLDKARINWNEGIYVIFILFIYNLFFNKNKFDVFILTWIVVPYILFSSFATKMNGYVLISSPAIFIITGKFVVDCWAKNTKICRLMAGLVVFLSLRYCVERVKPFYHNPDSIAQINVINKIKSVVPNKNNSIILNNPYYIETMFYTNIVSMRGVPTDNEIRTVKNQFKNIGILNEGENLPDWLLKDSSIQIINVTR